MNDPNAAAAPPAFAVLQEHEYKTLMQELLQLRQESGKQKQEMEELRSEKEEMKGKLVQVLDLGMYCRSHLHQVLCDWTRIKLL